MAIFINITANFNTQSAELSETPITLGRSTSCDIKLDDAMVSGRHISFYLKGGKIYAEDLDTTNGSFINGQALTKSVFTLKDEIKVGEIFISLDKSKMSVKEIFSHKGSGSDDKSSPTATATKGKASKSSDETDLPEKNPESQIDDKKSLSGLIRNAKVAGANKKKKKESTSGTTIMPKFISDDDEKKDEKKDLKGKLKGLFKKK